jgi:hypothetical protein
MPKPYVYINQRLQGYASLRKSLSGDANARLKFDLLNAPLRRHMILPGQLVIVGDVSSASITSEERQLMIYAGDVRHSIMSSGPAANDVMVQNFDLYSGGVLGWA